MKKDQTDRHWAGSGKIKIAAEAVDEYLAVVGRSALDETKYTICHDIRPTDIAQLHAVENEPLTEDNAP